MFPCVSSPNLYTAIFYVYLKDGSLIAFLSLANFLNNLYLFFYIHSTSFKHFLIVNLLFLIVILLYFLKSLFVTFLMPQHFSPKDWRTISVSKIQFVSITQIHSVPAKFSKILFNNTIVLCHFNCIQQLQILKILYIKSFIIIILI